MVWPYPITLAMLLAAVFAAGGLAREVRLMRRSLDKSIEAAAEQSKRSSVLEQEAKLIRLSLEMIAKAVTDLTTRVSAVEQGKQDKT